MLNKTYQREVACCWVPCTDFISITTDNNPGAVTFDFFSIWEYFKKLEVKPLCLVMLHSHPPGIHYMSSTDINMVDAWHKAFGIPIIYGIIVDGYTHIWDCEKTNKYLGVLSSHQDYENYESFIIPAVLEFLSYKPESFEENQISILSYNV